MATLTIKNSSCLVPLNCVEYGYLYNYFTLLDGRKLSSSDVWYVPSKLQYDALENYVSPDNTDAGTKLKDIGTTYWSTAGGTDIYGFSARGTGQRNHSPATFTGIRQQSYHWTSTNDGIDLARIAHFQASAATLQSALDNFRDGNTVRFVLNATGIADGTTTTYVGNDGKIYNAVAINGLYWMTEPLAETEYRNGDPIPTVEDNATWAGLTTGAKCAYDNNYEYVGCDEPQEPSGWCTLADAEYDNINLVHTGYSYTYGTFMSENGTKFFVTDYSSATILEYTLSTPFNISSATLSYAFSTSSQETSPSDVFWGDDGDYCFISGYFSDKITKYTVTTPYDLSTATYDSQSGNVMPAGINLPSLSGIAFNDDGTRMFISVHSQYSGSGIYEYTASSPYDLSVLTLTDNKITSFVVANTFEFTNNGNYLYVASQDGMVSFIKLTEPYSLSEYEIEKVDFPPNSGISQRTGITISSDGKKMYLTDNINNETRQYTLCP